MKQLTLILLILCTHLTLLGQTKCTQIVSGEVRDGISTDVLVGAEVTLTDGTGVVVETQTIKEDGAFSFTIQCETTYTIAGKQQDYTAESKTFTTTAENQKVLKLIILLDKGNIDFVTDGEANAKAMDTVATAEVVTPEIEPVIVDEEIKKSAVVPQEVVEKPKASYESVRKSKDDYATQISPVYFDYESSWLNQKAKSDLQKILVMMNKNPNMVLKCAGHTDAKGDDEYNQWMSDRRAKRVVDYLVQRGVSPSRISGKGYGETKLINDCTNEKDCTDSERAINRRTEFEIVKM